MPYVQCNGADLYYEEAGEGRPIVLLHGVMCGVRYFEHQLDELAQAYRPIAIDFRGHGRSEKVEYGHTLAQYARDVHTFLEERDLDDVVVVGWSLGALVSWEYVAQFGTERIGGLVDVDMEASRYQWDDYEFGLYTLKDLQQALSGIQEDEERMIERFTDQVFANPTAEMKTLQIDETSRTPTSVKSTILFDATTRDYRAVLPGIDVPVLVCAGSVETRGPGTVAAVKHVADLVPDGTFELFDGSGHCPPLEQPERFNRVLSEFVDAL